MTHEQKPESAEFLRNARAMQAKVKQRLADRAKSAEFRTREAHRQHIAQAWQDEGMSQSLAEAWADRELSEAEARGAAEQRREDAEGAEASAWRWRAKIYKGEQYGPWILVDHDPTPNLERNFYDIHEVEKLYTRPANVAALEARVRELEAQLGAMQNGTVRQVIHSPLRHFKSEDRS